MTLSQKDFQLMKYQSRKPTKFWFWWDSNPWLHHKIFLADQIKQEKPIKFCLWWGSNTGPNHKLFSSLLNNTGEAYKILALMGFKPMSLSQNIFQPIKFWLSDGMQTHYSIIKIFSSSWNIKAESL